MNRERAVAIVIATMLVVQLATIVLAQRYLSDWWFRTDACPDPSMTCGQPAPVMLPLVLVAGVSAVAMQVVLNRRDWLLA